MEKQIITGLMAIMIGLAGWNLKTTGSGGRSGRITGETLVCMTSNT